MIPLNLININEKFIVAKIIGKDEVIKHLNNLGVVCGNEISIVAKNENNLIISIFESRIGIDKLVASKIMVKEKTL